MTLKAATSHAATGWWPEAAARDLLSLARARMPELIAALTEERTLQGHGGSLPARAVQIAGLIVDETIRLIRLGTQIELADAGVEVAQTLVTSKIKRLAEREPEVHRLLSGASVALGAASAPSSGGGELTVLRSWNGKALQAVSIVSREAERALARAQLRERLAINESHLSHLLADLEGASLVVRIRSGREVMVHLGPAARSEHVQRLLAGQDEVDGPAAYNDRAPGGSRLREIPLDPFQMSEDRALPVVDATEITMEFTSPERRSLDLDNIARGFSLAPPGHPYEAPRTPRDRVPFTVQSDILAILRRTRKIPTPQK